MQCLYAFLLIPQNGLESTKRLAIMRAEYASSHYDIFKLEPDEFFPVIEHGIEIKTTQGDITEPGTYARAYCSQTISKYDLIKHVTKGLKSARDESHLGLGDADEAAEKCLGMLQTLSRQTKDSSQQYVSPAGYTQLSSPDSPPYSPRITKGTGMKFKGRLGISSLWTEKPPKIFLSKIREMEGCSDLGLISLAYQKKIKVTGSYRFFAPENSDGRYEVEFDDEVDINKIVFPGQILAQFIHHHKYYVIAWYMGHLHVFKKDNLSAKWWPDTLMGSEKRSGRRIIQLISTYYEVLNPVTKIINKLEKHDYNSDCISINCYGSTRAFQQEENRLISEIRSLRLRRLPGMGESITG